MNDERFLKDWLQDTTDSTSDLTAAADKVVARLPGTPQRRRWLAWLPVRRPKHDDTSTTRRTRLMLSPLQTVTAGALTLAIAGVMLVAAPFEDATAPAPPGAEAIGSGEVIAFEGFVPYGTGEQLATREVLDDGVVTNREQIWRISDAETTDTRFGGSITNTWNYDEYPEDDGLSVWTGGWNIENDEGGWHQRPIVNFGYPDGTYTLYTAVFVGVGGYAGLTAIVEIDEDQGRGGFNLRGMILDGPLPPVPSLLEGGATE